MARVAIARLWRGASYLVSLAVFTHRDRSLEPASEPFPTSADARWTPADLLPCDRCRDHSRRRCVQLGSLRDPGVPNGRYDCLAWGGIRSGISLRARSIRPCAGLRVAVLHLAQRHPSRSIADRSALLRGL